MSRLLLGPFIPSVDKALQSDCPGNLRQPTSTGNLHARHPTCWHCWVSGWYFPSFLSWASSILSSHGTVSSSNTTCFVALDHRTMSGLRVEVVIFSGNLSCLRRSTLMSQSVADVRIPEPLDVALELSPALTNLIIWGATVLVMLWVFLLSSSRPVASSASIWSCLHLNLPSARLALMTTHVQGLPVSHTTCSLGSQPAPNDGDSLVLVGHCMWSTGGILSYSLPCPIYPSTPMIFLGHCPNMSTSPDFSWLLPSLAYPTSELFLD